jgi:UDP-N-acetylglucosamine acyltransferase
MAVHSTAIIGPDVVLAEDVEIGPFALLTGKVRIGARTKIDSHAVIGSENAETILGEENWILAGACVGNAPQDLSYKGESTSLVMGNKNVIREYVTLNVGTEKGGGVTKLGNENMIMAYTHLGHDCIIKNNVVIVNSCQFAGHVEVDDNAVIGGMSGIAQFCRIGAFAYVGGNSSVNKDVMPFTIAEGNWAKSRATNKIGLERAGYSKDEVMKVNKAIRYLTKGERTMDETMQLIEAELLDSELVQQLVKFIQSSKKGIAR